MSGGWAEFFERYPATTRPTSPVEPLGNAGGLSGARLYRFRSGRDEFVARQWPVDVTIRGRLDRIHAWLKATCDLGFVPVPLTTLDGRTAIDWDGRAWEVAPWMPGTADLARPPSPEHRRLAFSSLAAFLGRLAPGQTEGQSPGLVHRVGEIERLRLGDFEAIRSTLDRAPADPASPMARRWLDRAVALAPSVVESTRIAASRPLPLQPCLRDARPDHFLFEGDRLSGLVDFGAMGVDSVAGDLARVIGEWIGPDRLARREALAAFEAIRPLDDAEVRAIEAFERANALLGAVAWIRWHYLERRTFDEPDAVARGLTKCLRRLDEVF